MTAILSVLRFPAFNRGEKQVVYKNRNTVGLLPRKKIHFQLSFTEKEEMHKNAMLL